MAIADFGRLKIEKIAGYDTWANGLPFVARLTLNL